MSRSQRAVYASGAFPIDMQTLEVVYGGLTYPEGCVHVFSSEQLDAVTAGDLAGGRALAVHVPGMARQDVYNHVKGLGFSPGIETPIIEHPWCMLRADKLHQIANAATHGVPSEQGRLAIVCTATGVLPLTKMASEQDQALVTIIEECIAPRRLVILAAKVNA